MRNSVSKLAAGAIGAVLFMVVSQAQSSHFPVFASTRFTGGHSAARIFQSWSGFHGRSIGTGSGLRLNGVGIHAGGPLFVDSRRLGHQHFQSPGFKDRSFRDPRFRDDRLHHRFRKRHFDERHFGSPRFEFRDPSGTRENNEGPLRPWTYPLTPWTYPLQ